MAKKKTSAATKSAASQPSSPPTAATTRSKNKLTTTPSETLPETTTTQPESTTIPAPSPDSEITLTDPPQPPQTNPSSTVKSSPSPTTISTRSKTMHVTPDEPLVPESDGLSNEAPQQPPVSKRVSKRSKGVVITELEAPTSHPEEPAPVLGKGKGKIVVEDDGNLSDKEWKTDVKTAMRILRDRSTKRGKGQTSKRKRSASPECEGEKVIAPLNPELHTSLDRDQVLEYLQNANLSDDDLVLSSNLLEHQILPGRYYPLSWLGSKPAFSFFLDILADQKWTHMFTTKSAVYVPEILQFYQSVSVNNQCTLLSAKINGQTFALRSDMFAKMFRIPHMGLDELGGKKSWPALVNLDPLTVLQYFDPAISVVQSQVNPGILDAPHQFLFNVVRRTITPRPNSRGYYQISDLLLLYHLMMRKPVNLACIVFHHIKDVAADLKRHPAKKRELPYGMWLTHVFHNLKLLSDDGVCVDMDDRMSDGLLGQMHIRIVDNQLRGLRSQTSSGTGTGTETGTGGTGAVTSRLDDLLDATAGGLGGVAAELAAMKELMKEILARLPPRT